MHPIIQEAVGLLLKADALQLHEQTMSIVGSGEDFEPYFGRFWATDHEFLCAYLVLLATELGPKYPDSWQPVRDYVKTQATQLGATTIWPYLTTKPRIDLVKVVQTLA